MRCAWRLTYFAAPLFLLFAACLPLLAQEISLTDVVRNPGQGGNVSRFAGLEKTPYEFWLTVMIALFGLSVIGTLMFALRRATSTRPEDISRPIIVVTVISGTLMLVTVGYSNEQIAPAFGLFGTIVGYMLGRFSQTSSEQPSPATVSEKTKIGSGTGVDTLP